jgi:hypothetical protein
MNNYVALITDATGAYATVYVQAKSWSEAIDMLEDTGCEVIEDQTSDYEEEDFVSPASLARMGLYTIDTLLKSNFVPLD